MPPENVFVSISLSPECLQIGKPNSPPMRTIRNRQNDIFCDFGSQGRRFEPCRVQVLTDQVVTTLKRNQKIGD